VGRVRGEQLVAEGLGTLGLTRTLVAGGVAQELFLLGCRRRRVSDPVAEFPAMDVKLLLGGEREVLLQPPHDAALAGADARLLNGEHRCGPEAAEGGEGVERPVRADRVVDVRGDRLERGAVDDVRMRMEASLDDRERDARSGRVPAVYAAAKVEDVPPAGREEPHHGGHLGQRIVAEDGVVLQDEHVLAVGHRSRLRDGCQVRGGTGEVTRPGTTVEKRPLGDRRQTAEWQPQRTQSPCDAATAP